MQRNKYVGTAADRLPLAKIGGVLLTALLAVSLLVGLWFTSAASAWREFYTAFGLAPAPLGEDVLEVHFLDVGNGDCILIRQGASALLMDGGERGDGAAILEYLNRHGVTRLDGVIVTHSHSDHVGGLPQIVAALPVERLLVSALPTEEEKIEPVYRELLNTSAQRDIPVQTVQRGDTLVVGDAVMQVLGPVSTMAEENDRSLVIRLTFGDHAFLFTGDAGAAAESALLYSGAPLQSDVLKVGHHGSNAASTAAFLRRVAPSYGVIPCGRNNFHGHPSPYVLQRLLEENICVLRSDIHGAIRFVSDGHTLTVKTENG